MTIARSSRRNPPLAAVPALTAPTQHDADEPNSQSHSDTLSTHTTQSSPSNLTLPRTPLIGRDYELATVQQMLLQEHIGLLTLTGAGGIGKTRLAIQIAANLLDHFVDGVYFVSLAPISDPELVSTTIAQTLGVCEASGRSLQQSLQEHLRDKQLLLVLDNFEQILTAAPLVSALLQESPRLKALVTSRATLHLYGEQEFPVPPLALPSAKRLSVTGMSAIASVELFCQRASMAKPDFVLTANNAADVAKICIGLDGLPLAIELAAARIKVFSPATLLARLDQRLTILTGGPQDLPARQRTLRDEIAWSYDLLTADEQILFRRLAVFAGSFMFEMVEPVCGEARTNQGERAALAESTRTLLDLLAHLADKSLVVIENEQPDVGIVETRYRLLETLRAYASEQLELANETYSIQMRHAEYFFNLAVTAERHMERKEKKHWLERLQADYTNLCAALAWLIATDATAAQQMARLLWRFWEANALLSEGCNWLAKTLAASTVPTPTRAWALWAKALLTDDQGDYKQAQALVQECLLIFQAQGDLVGRCEALSLMGYTLINADQGAQALPYMEQCLALARHIGHQECLAHALVGLGDVYIQLRRPPAQILPFFEESAQIYEMLGDLQGFAYTFHAQARVHLVAGDYRQGVALGQKALVINREMGSHLDVAFVLTTLGAASWFGGERVAACGYWEEARLFFQAANNKVMLREVWYGFGMAARYLLAVADTAFTRHTFDDTTRLLSVVQKILDNQPPFLDAVANKKYSEMLTTLRHACSEETFTALWAEGQQWALAEAVAFALTLPGAPVPLDRPPWLHVTQAVVLTSPDAPMAIKPSPLPPLPKIYPAGLTAREVEVLRLLAQGLTYAQIAEKLIITRRTVNGHVTSIYSKLDVNGRAAATRFALEYRLV